MAAEPKRTAGDRVLPLEIWREILSRVPVKSILRCRSVCKSWYSLISRSVCKSWYSLISDPYFTSEYSVRNLNKNGNRVLLQPFDYSGSPCEFTSHDESFMESYEHEEMPQAFLGNASKARIVGSCNGLICLFKYERYDGISVMRFLIWNPTIRKVVEVRSRPFCHSILEPSYCGFGFDFKTGDYKIMFTCMHSRKKCDCSDVNANVCEVFDLRKGVWRGISPPACSWHSWDDWGRAPECYVNGFVHWTRSTRHGWGPGDKVLLSFNTSDEIFREIRMPDCVEFIWNRDYAGYIETRSVAFQGLIHVIVWMVEQNHLDINVISACSVWAMKEYGVTESWTILFNIDLEDYQDAYPYNFRLLENGEVLMLLPRDDDDDDDNDEHYDWDAHEESEDRQELFVYNTDRSKCKQLISFDMCIKDICLYEESLVLM